MVPVRGYAERRVMVLGLKGPGFAAARALAAGGARVTVWDNDGPARLKVHVGGLTVEDPTERDWGDLAALIVEDALLVTAEEPPRLIELARAVEAPVLAARCLLAEAVARDGAVKLALVTGRHGEAAAHLARHMMDAAGLAVADLVSAADAMQGGWVVGALDAAEFALLPDIVEAEAFAVLTPEADTGGAAFDRLADAASRGLIASADARATARLIASRRGARTVAISGRQVLGGGAYAAGGGLFDALDGKAVCAGVLTPRAPLEAAAAGYALARRLGVGPDDASRALQVWRGAPGHGRQVMEFGPVSLIDWSAAHTPAGAMDAACGREATVWIAGPGLDPHTGDLLAEAGGCVRAVHLVTDRARAAKALNRSAPCTVHRTLAAAIAHAVHDALKTGARGCTVVYAPGSVSGDTPDGLEAAANALMSRALEGDAA